MAMSVGRGAPSSLKSARKAILSSDAASLEGIETQGRGRAEGEEKEAEKEEEENTKERKVVRIDAALFLFCCATNVGRPR